MYPAVKAAVDHSPHKLAVERTAIGPDKQRVGSRNTDRLAPELPVTVYGLSQFGSERYDTVLVTLAVDFQLATHCIYITVLKAYKFAAPHTCRVEHQQYQMVTHSDEIICIDLVVQDMLHLRFAYMHRQPLGLFGKYQLGCRIGLTTVLIDEITEKRSERLHFQAYGGRLEITTAQRQHPTPQVMHRYFREVISQNILHRQSLPYAPKIKPLGQMHLIGIDRAGRIAEFMPQMIEKFADKTVHKLKSEFTVKLVIFQINDM